MEDVTPPPPPRPPPPSRPRVGSARAAAASESNLSPLLVGIVVLGIVALVGFFAWRQVNSSRVQVAGLELDKANVVNERTNTELGLAKVELDRLARQHEFETWEQCNDHWTETGLGTCRQDDNGTPYGVCGDSSKYGPGCQNTCDAPLRIYEFDVADGSGNRRGVHGGSCECPRARVFADRPSCDGPCESGFRGDNCNLCRGQRVPINDTDALRACSPCPPEFRFQDSTACGDREADDEGHVQCRDGWLGALCNRCPEPKEIDPETGACVCPREFRFANRELCGVDNGIEDFASINFPTRVANPRECEAGRGGLNCELQPMTYCNGVRNAIIRPLREHPDLRDDAGAAATGSDGQYYCDGCEINDRAGRRCELSRVDECGGDPRHSYAWTDRNERGLCQPLRREVERFRTDNMAYENARQRERLNVMEDSDPKRLAGGPPDDPTLECVGLLGDQCTDSAHSDTCRWDPFNAQCTCSNNRFGSDCTVSNLTTCRGLGTVQQCSTDADCGNMLINAANPHWNPISDQRCFASPTRPVVVGHEWRPVGQIPAGGRQRNDPRLTAAIQERDGRGEALRFTEEELANLVDANDLEMTDFVRIGSQIFVPAPAWADDPNCFRCERDAGHRNGICKRVSDSSPCVCIDGVYGGTCYFDNRGGEACSYGRVQEGTTEGTTDCVCTPLLNPEPIDGIFCDPNKPADERGSHCVNDENENVVTARSFSNFRHNRSGRGRTPAAYFERIRRALQAGGETTAAFQGTRCNFNPATCNVAHGGGRAHTCTSDADCAGLASSEPWSIRGDYRCNTTEGLCQDTNLAQFGGHGRGNDGNGRFCVCNEGFGGEECQHATRFDGASTPFEDGLNGRHCSGVRGAWFNWGAPHPTRSALEKAGAWDVFSDARGGEAAAAAEVERLTVGSQADLRCMSGGAGYPGPIMEWAEDTLTDIQRCPGGQLGRNCHLANECPEFANDDALVTAANVVRAFETYSEDARKDLKEKVYWGLHDMMTGLRWQLQPTQPEDTELLLSSENEDGAKHPLVEALKAETGVEAEFSRRDWESFDVVMLRRNDVVQTGPVKFWQPHPESGLNVDAWLDLTRRQVLDGRCPPDQPDGTYGAYSGSGDAKQHCFGGVARYARTDTSGFESVFSCDCSDATLQRVGSRCQFETHVGPNREPFCRGSTVGGLNAGRTEEGACDCGATRGNEAGPRCQFTSGQTCGRPAIGGGWEDDDFDANDGKLRFGRLSGDGDGHCEECPMNLFTNTHTRECGDADRGECGKDEYSHCDWDAQTAPPGPVKELGHCVKGRAYEGSASNPAHGCGRVNADTFCNGNGAVKDPLPQGGATPECDCLSGFTGKRCEVTVEDMCGRGATMDSDESGNPTECNCTDGTTTSAAMRANRASNFDTAVERASTAARATEENRLNGLAAPGEALHQPSGRGAPGQPGGVGTGMRPIPFWGCDAKRCDSSDENHSGGNEVDGCECANGFRSFPGSKFCNMPARVYFGGESNIPSCGNPYDHSASTACANFITTTNFGRDPAAPPHYDRETPRHRPTRGWETGGSARGRHGNDDGASRNAHAACNLTGVSAHRNSYDEHNGGYYWRCGA